MTTLTYNSTTDRYEASVDGQFVEVDSDVYAEERQGIMKEIACEQGLLTREQSLEDLTKKDHDRLYWQADAELLSAEIWLDPPMDGVYVDGKPLE